MSIKLVLARLQLLFRLLLLQLVLLPSSFRKIVLLLLLLLERDSRKYVREEEEAGWLLRSDLGGRFLSTILLSSFVVKPFSGRRRGVEHAVDVVEVPGMGIEASSEPAATAAHHRHGGGVFLLRPRADAHVQNSLEQRPPLLFFVN